MNNLLLYCRRLLILALKMENGTFPDLDINTASIIESGGTPAKNC